MVSHFLKPTVESNKACHTGNVIHEDNSADIPIVVMSD